MSLFAHVSQLKVLSPEGVRLVGDDTFKASEVKQTPTQTEADVQCATVSATVTSTLFGLLRFCHVCVTTTRFANSYLAFPLCEAPASDVKQKVALQFA